MSKFAKRIKKLNKKARNVLILGNAWGNIQDLTENFSTIFLIDDHRRILRGRNVVFREDFNNIHLISDIDVILVDLDHQNYLKELIPVLKRWNSIVLTEGKELISKENQTFLKSHNYQIVEINKSYFQWKLR